MPWRRMGSGCIDSHFLDLGTSWRWVVNFTPRPLYPQGKSPQYPLDRRLGGPQNRSGRFGEVKILTPTGTRTPTPRSSSPQLVAIPTTLSRLILLKLWHSEMWWCIVWWISIFCRTAAPSSVQKFSGLLWNVGTYLSDYRAPHLRRSKT
jgi:hypothetical protein